MSNRVEIIKMALSIFLVILLCIDSYAAVISDNDGSAFVTKAEFDALKSSFNSQIDSYNNSIDSKIDGAIASYLAGLSLSKKMVIGNNYAKLKADTPFVWGQSLTNQATKMYGGHVTHVEVGDTKSAKKSTIDASNDVDMYCFASEDTDCKKVHMCLYKEKMTYYESTTYNFYQGAAWTNHKITVQESTIINGIMGKHPQRDGTPTRVSFVQKSLPEAGSSTIWIVENYEPDRSKIPVFSMDNTSNEYILPMIGYTDTQTSTKTTEDKVGSKVGDFSFNSAQLVRKEVYIEWAQAIKHNDLIIYEWSSLTGNDEKIKTGMPVVSVDSKGKLEFSVQATKNGTLYAYCAGSPQEYSTLVDNNKDVRVISLTANTEEKVELKECEKGTYLRIGFLPGTAGDISDLDITSDIVLTVER